MAKKNTTGPDLHLVPPATRAQHVRLRPQRLATRPRGGALQQV